MPRKVIIDCDLGTDDAVALCMALFASEIEVLAVTATEGCVTAQQANNNLQVIVSMLDPVRHPRIGTASHTQNAPAVDTRYLHGEDGLGNSGFETSQLQHALPSEKLIADCIRANPDEVTILCLGPLTNLARALQHDPTLESRVGQILIVGGSLDGRGNITACAEFNFYFDPVSAKTVLGSRTTKTLIPLDVTREVCFGLEMQEALPKPESRAGDFLRKILPFSFRAYRQQMGMESIYLNDATGALALLEPDLFEYEAMHGDVEAVGELTRGVLVVDRRPQPESQRNLSVATSVQSDAAKQAIFDRLMVAGNLSSK